jgi:outer membrane receptor protein involved in Fe transport
MRVERGAISDGIASCCSCASPRILKRDFGDNRDGSILRDGFGTVLPNHFTSSADRVEVLKGPFSMMYRIADPGGVVNVVSKRPELTQHGSLSVKDTSFSGGGVTGPIGKDGFAYLLQKLRDVFGDHPFVGDIRGVAGVHRIGQRQG